MKPKKQRPGRPRQQRETLPRFYDSMWACSNATRTPLRALRVAKRGGCPAFHNSRVDFLEFQKWWFIHESKSGVDWGDKLRQFQACREELKLQTERGLVIEFESVEQFIRKLCGQFFWAELERLGQELPPTLKGQTELAIHTIVVTEVEKIKVNQEKFQELWLKTHKPKSENEKHEANS